MKEKSLYLKAFIAIALLTPLSHILLYAEDVVETPEKESVYSGVMSVNGVSFIQALFNPPAVFLDAWTTPTSGYAYFPPTWGSKTIPPPYNRDLSFSAGVDFNLELKTSSSSTFLAVGQYSSASYQVGSIDTYGAKVSFRFYSKKTAPEGFYAGVTTGMHQVKITARDPYFDLSVSDEGTQTFGGATLGFQWIDPGGNFSLDFGADFLYYGAGITARAVNIKAQSIPSYGVNTEWRLSLGYPLTLTK